MNFEPTPEQRLIADTARQFAEQHLVKKAAQRDRDSEFPAAELGKLAELGLLGVNVPEALGGVRETLATPRAHLAGNGPGHAQQATPPSNHPQSSLDCCTLLAQYRSPCRRRPDRAAAPLPAGTSRSFTRPRPR